eukprot:NODE_1710_length_761_cov_19.274448_g1661_i0.p1 GENE.NODE_1710_length_761_cov_19.274448_g1661_i0~~NODE_1710_length_761_cov_19.274448_g1661_i0.p1  ORF type:complete len:135 (+),score=17.94 NODE_1710_length_761_cov_19.274448_g1661_i0:276-680(+)
MSCVPWEFALDVEEFHTLGVSDFIVTASDGKATTTYTLSFVEPPVPENSATPSPFSGSGGQDPHFHGFHHEQLDLIHDETLEGAVLSLFCDDVVHLKAVLGFNEEELLFIVQFHLEIGDLQVLLFIFNIYSFYF